MSGKLYLDPGSQTLAVGSNLVMTIHEDSGSAAINAIQANFDYPTDKFDFAGIDVSTSDFGLEASMSGDGGKIRIARAVTPGDPAVTGDKVVAVVTLRAKAAGTAQLTNPGGSAIVRADDATDVLTTVTGGNYTITGGAAGTGATPTPAPTVAVTPVPTPAPVAKPVTVPVVHSTKAIPVSKTIVATTPAIPVEDASLAVDGKPIDTPVIDTTKLDDGTHTITATSKDGTKKVEQKITVNNNQPALQRFLGAAKGSAPWIALVLVVLAGIGVAFHYFYKSGTEKLAVQTGGSMSQVSRAATGTLYTPKDDK